MKLLIRLFDTNKKEKIKRNIASSRVILYFSILLLIISTIFFILTVTRINIHYYKIIAVIVSCIIIFVICVSAFYLLHFKEIYLQCLAINNNDSSIFVGKVIDIIEKPITLSDSSKVIVIKFIDKHQKIKEFYLLSFFDNPFCLNNNYILGVVNDFIKEYKHEA